MTATDSIFQRALSNMLTEIFDGPPGQEAFVLNPGDPGLLRQYGGGSRERGADCRCE